MHESGRVRFENFNPMLKKNWNLNPGGGHGIINAFVRVTDFSVMVERERTRNQEKNEIKIRNQI